MLALRAILPVITFQSSVVLPCILPARLMVRLQLPVAVGYGSDDNFVMLMRREQKIPDRVP